VDQAAEWLVRLEEDTSAETVALWAQWLREDAKRHAVFLRVENGWRQAERLQSLRPLDGTVNPNVLETFPGVRRRSRQRLARSVRSALSAGLKAPFSALAVALGAAALASLLVLAGWNLLMSP
jgi:ferric-dicitrate binding protein FerR (iron transport regulator)